MAPADRPDFPGSRAILVGTSDYTHLPPLPAAMNSLDAVANLLTGELCGWPADRVEIFRNSWDVNYLNRTLARLTRETTDVLFFYYVGHGQPTLNDDLCMGLVDTATDPADREFSGLLMETVRRMLAASPARVKVVVLDCCFSGIATAYRQSGAEDAYIAGLTRVQGAYTLTASEAHMPARYETGPAPFTQFSKNLTELVRAGIPGAPRQLTLDVIFPHLQMLLRRQGLPEPTRMSIRDAGSFVFARNAAPVATHVDPDAEIQQLRRNVAEAEAREYALRVEFQQRADELKRLHRELAAVGVLDTDEQRLRAAVDQAAETVTATVDAATAAQVEVEVAIQAARQVKVADAPRRRHRPRSRRATALAAAALALLAVLGAGVATLLTRSGHPSYRTDAAGSSAKPLPATAVVWSAGEGNARNNVVVGDVDEPGRPTRSLTSDTTGADNPVALSPGRQTVLYVRSAGADATGTLCAAATDGSGHHPLFRANTQAAGLQVTGRPSWSPDGERIAVVGTWGHQDGLFLVTLADDHVHLLIRAPARRIGDPAFSPDGKLIAYWASATAGRSGFVMTASATNGMSRTVVSGQSARFDTAPAWSPDSKAIAFRRGVASTLQGNSDIYVTHRTPQGWQTPVDLTRELPTNDQDPAWSPDGAQIVFGSGPDPSHRRIFVMSSTGTHPRPISPAEPPWANAPTF